MVIGSSLSRYFSCGAALVLSMLLIVPAQAQSDGDEDYDQSGVIEEITVTAQKREASLQSTPISMTAFTAGVIEDQNITTVDDISDFTPNVNIHPNAGGNSGVTVGMRGVSTSDPIITLEPTVGIYKDGVYISKSAGSMFQMGDLQRIEVLRGPQGTLYGRNTTGGAINLITKKPSGQWGIDQKLRIGNYSYFNSETAIDAPINGEGGLWNNHAAGNLSARVSFAYAGRDGWVENISTVPVQAGGAALGSGDFDDLNRLSTSAALRWEPSDMVTVDYNFDYHRSRENPSAFQLSGIYDGAAVGFLSPYIRSNRVKSIGNNNVRLHVGYAPDGTPLFEEKQLENSLDVRGHALTIAWEVGELGALGHVEVKSISGYRNLDTTEDQDLDGTNFRAAEFGLIQDQEQYTQELQWIGTGAWDGRIDYVAGFYYFTEDGGELSRQTFFGGANAFTSINRFDNEAWALFTQATVTPPVFEDRFSITVGARYTEETKKAKRDYDCVNIASESGNLCDLYNLDFQSDRKQDFDNFSPMINLAYQASDDVMGYFKVSRGFKSGGFNGRATKLAEFERPFDEETLTAWELGMKSQWIDNRLQLNVAGFFSDYKDLQATVFEADQFGGTASNLTNAGSAEIWGAEVEMMALPVPSVDVRIAYGWLDPEYKEFCASRDVDGNCTADVADQREFVLSPDHSISAGIGYTGPPTENGIFSARLDAYWQDSVVFLIKDNDLDAQGSYALLNGRIELGEIPVESGTVDLALWGRNLLDKSYREFGIDFGRPENRGLGYAGNIYGDPRTFGIEMIWNWEKI